MTEVAHAGTGSEDEKSTQSGIIALFIRREVGGKIFSTRRLESVGRDNFGHFRSERGCTKL